MERLPQAQRVIGCGAWRSRLALTQRRATTTRSPFVGKVLADLPSGERANASSHYLGNMDAAPIRYN
jgi:hypothetical protein